MGWGPWSSVSEGSTKPGGVVTPVAAGAGRIALFVADRSGGVYTALGSPTAGWGPWSSVSEGSTVPGGVVTAVAADAGLIALFLTDPNGGVYTALGSPTAGWGPWSSVSEGGTVPGGVVTAVAVDAGRIALFVADRSGGVYTALGSPTSGWGPWSSVSQGSTVPGGMVTAVAAGAGQIALFLADPGGGVYTALGSPAAGWGPWSSVSEGSTKPGGVVTAVATGAGQIALFLADPGGGVYTALGSPTAGWGPWSSVSQGSTVPGGVVTPVAADAGQIALFLADPGGGVYTALGSPTAGWGRWWNVSQGRTVPGGAVTAVAADSGQFALFVADHNGGVYTTLGFGESFVLGSAVGDLLDISRIDSSPWTNPAYDTSDPNWSANVAGGRTFDGSSSHPLEWISVLNPTVEQDDEVGLAGTAIHPEDSGADLPFTHPFGPDFEFAIDPDPAYAGLLATANKDPSYSGYRDSWTVAQASGIPVPSGLLGLEIDGALVPPDYRVAQGDRVAVYGRWIVDAGHAGFHTEIHPPLLMAFARAVDSGDNPIPASASATTLCRLWSRPYQAGQLFSTDGHSRLPLQDYLNQIAFTVREIRAYPPVFATPFVGTHVVAFTIHPPARIAPTARGGTWEVQCSYHFTVNGSCAVQVMPSPAEPNSLLVIVKLDSAGFPSLPEPPSQFDTYSIDSLLKQAPSDVNISWIKDIWLDIKGDVHIRRYTAPQMSKTQDSVNVVPFTSISAIASTTGWATDNSQPFPIYGWVRLRWARIDPRLGL